jgi:phosphoribosylglycinamide formyltransferase-1
LESGVSVHLVDDTYDTGRVIRQVRVPVEAKDSVESLKARVRECERDVVVQTLAAVARGELRLAAAG